VFPPTSRLNLPVLPERGNLRPLRPANTLPNLRQGIHRTVLRAVPLGGELDDRRHMRITHYLESLDTKVGGPVRATLDLTSALAARGHEVVYVTKDDTSAPILSKGLLSDARPGRVVVVQILPGNGLILGSGPAWHACREAIARSDAVHVHGIWKLENVALCREASRNRVPYFVSLRGMLDDWSVAQKPLKKRLFHAAVGRRHLELAAAVHCTAQGELDQSGKWFPGGRGVVIPNLLDLDPFRSPPGTGRAQRAFPVLTNGRPSVLFLSRIHYKKGVDVLIDAAAILKSRGVPCNMIIAGTGDDGYVAEMKARAAGARLADDVVFVGHLDGDAKLSLYQACQLFALPTSQENFGFVFPEALASGTPVITTKGVDIWPELLSSGAASIVDRTPGAFADEIQRLLGDETARLGMAEKARPYVFRAFDENALLDQYEAMYSAGVARRGPPQLS